MDKHNYDEEGLTQEERELSPTSQSADGSAQALEASVIANDNQLAVPCKESGSTEMPAPSEMVDGLASKDTEEEKLSDEIPQLSSENELKCAIEALLFATTEPLSVGKLSKILDVANTAAIRSALLQLMQDYDTTPRGLQIVEVAGGFQMATRPSYAPFIFRLKPSRRRNPLSQATLETLAIIAYKQPITRAEIEAIRGVDSTACIHTLLELGLIEIGGKREVPGRPQLYVTTQHFLKTFGLRSLGDLPSIHELKRMFADQKEREDKATRRGSEDSVVTPAPAFDYSSCSQAAGPAEPTPSYPQEGETEGHPNHGVLPDTGGAGESPA